MIPLELLDAPPWKGTRWGKWRFACACGRISRCVNWTADYWVCRAGFGCRSVGR